MSESAPNVVRMKLGCRDRTQFLSEFAPKMASRVFVPMANPPEAGSVIALHIRFEDGEVHVKGIAEVIKVVHAPRDGVHVRFTALDADSIQFQLGGAHFDPLKSGISAAVTAPGPLPAHSPAGPTPFDISFSDVTNPAVPAPAAPRASAPSSATFRVSAPLGVPPPPKTDAVPLPGAKPSSPSNVVSPTGTFRALTPDTKTDLKTSDIPGLRPSSPSRAEAKTTEMPLPAPRASPSSSPSGFGSFSSPTDAKKPSTLVPGSVLSVGPSNGGSEVALPGSAGPAPSKPSALVPGSVLTVGPATGGSEVALPGTAAPAPAKKPSTLVPGSVLSVGPQTGGSEVSLPGAAGPTPVKPSTLVPGSVLSIPSAGGSEVALPGTAAKPRPSSPSSIPAARPSNPAAPKLGPSPSKPDFRPPTISRSEAPAPVAPVPEVTRPAVPRAMPASPASPASPPRPVSSAPFALDLEGTRQVPQQPPPRATPPPAMVTAPEPAFTPRPSAPSTATRPAVVLPPRMAPANIVDRAEEPASRKGLFIGLGVVALVGVIVAVVVVMSGPSGSGGKDGKSGQPKADAALVATLVRIDERMMAGEYTGPGGNTALDHLRAAVKAAPGDARVKERQQKLVLLFEQRADDAMKRGDLAEVAVQLTALSLADPSRPGVSERLADAESRVKNQHKK